MTDLHLVRYLTKGGDHYRQTEPMSWPQAITEWQRLDDLRRDGDLPWVDHFEVRSADDPSNPEQKIPTRPSRRDDHPANLRLKNVELKPGQRVYTFQCLTCGRAYQGSGLGVGSHRRACPSYARRTA